MMEKVEIKQEVPKKEERKISEKVDKLISEIGITSKKDN